MALTADVATVTAELSLIIDTMAPKLAVDVVIADGNPLPLDVTKRMLAKALRAAAAELYPEDD